MKRLNSHKYNVLLVKDDVGVAKPTTRRLPNKQFFYGRPEVRDAEDAHKVTMAWEYSRRGEPKT